MPPRLTVELVPASSWGDNLRSRLPRKEWDRLRRAQYEAAGHLCEICGGRGRYHPVECHETWAYDDDAGVQTLTGLIALCPTCHMVKHLGLTFIKRKWPQAIKHLMKVNDWNEKEAKAYAEVVFKIFDERSKRKWTLNLDWLLGVGVESSVGNLEPPRLG